MQHIQMEFEKKKKLNSTHTNAHEIMQHHMEILNPNTQAHIEMQVFLFFPNFMHLKFSSNLVHKK
jgi:hypothetical protein